MLLALHHHHHRPPPKVTEEGWLSDLEKTVLAEKAKAKLLKLLTALCVSLTLSKLQLKKAVHEIHKLESSHNLGQTQGRYVRLALLDHISSPSALLFPVDKAILVLRRFSFLSRCCDRSSKAQVEAL